MRLRTAAFTPTCTAVASSAAISEAAAHAMTQQLGAAPTAMSVRQCVQWAATAPGGASTHGLALSFACGVLLAGPATGAMRKLYTFCFSQLARVRRLVMLVVVRTWRIYISMLGAACMVLLRARLPGCDPASDSCIVFDDEGRSRWGEAWAILRAGFSEAARTASEGMSTMGKIAELELNLRSTQVGAAGVAWLQYLVDRVTPLRLEAVLEEVFEEVLAEMPSIADRRIVKQSFSLGVTSPVLRSARMYDLPASENALAFDVDIYWASEQSGTDLLAVHEGEGASVPMSVRNVVFEGPVRFIVTHLTKEAPGYGAILMSLPEPPKIQLDVRVVGTEVTRVPWLRGEIERALQNTLALQLLWPRRVIAPADLPGTIDCPWLSPEAISELESDDPLLRLERGVEDIKAEAGLEVATTTEHETEASLARISLGLADMDLSAFDKMVSFGPHQFGDLTVPLHGMSNLTEIVGGLQKASTRVGGLGAHIGGIGEQIGGISGPGMPQ